MMSEFQFKQFTIKQADSAMKVGTDSVLLGSLLEADSPHRILDIGTGTGLLALMMAQRFGAATIDAIEIDTAAANEAQFNINKSKWHQRIFVHNKTFQVFAEQAGVYDLIISNPPYYPAADHYKIEEHQRSNARQTQSLSFDDLVSGVNRLLSDDGICWMVLPTQEAEILITKAIANGLYLNRQILVHSKLSKAYNRVIFSLSKKAAHMAQSTFVIYEEEGGYTQLYKQTTMPFLLWNKSV
jgi:tRNA1Val (adenine37-N6)-methyltransferase